MSVQTVEIRDFLKLAAQHPLFDTRSEKEFEKGHIKGALNLPLLDNESRVVIGTLYKKECREAAVAKGFELVGPKFHTFISEVNRLVSDKKVLVYCWRGGMRSNIMAWVLSMAGYKVYLLKGGYKIFRNFAIEQFSQFPKLIVIGGKTGTGKTEFIKYCQHNKIPALNLEAVANHRGSAYGGIGLGPQPTQEQFENNLALELYAKNSEIFCLLENESRMIGKVKLPDVLFEAMRMADVAQIEEPVETRIARIKEEYAVLPLEDLIANTQKIEKRLGNLQMRNAVKALETGDFEEWIRILLYYYDDNYGYSNSLRDAAKIKVFKDFTDYDELISGIRKTFNI